MKRDGTLTLRKAICIKAAVFAGVFFSFWLVDSLQAQQCVVCERPITGGTVYTMIDRVDGVRKEMCEDCSKLPDVCCECDFPVGKNRHVLGDGRYLCPRDVKRVVLDLAEGDRICHQAVWELERSLSRFMQFPTKRVQLGVVDQLKMDEVLNAPTYHAVCPVLLAYTTWTTNASGLLDYEIGVLTGQTRARLMAVTAHEYGHVWLMENLPDDRELNPGAEEGFCNFMGCLLMRQLGETRELELIRDTGVGRDQCPLFLRDEQVLGMYWILEWIKRGVHSELSVEDTDRIRKHEVAKPQATNKVVWQPPPLPAKPRVPDQLTLQGILGQGRTRLALINGKPFGVDETGKAPVGEDEVSLRCVEIREGSVLIELSDSGTRQELRLSQEGKE